MSTKGAMISMVSYRFGMFHKEFGALLNITYKTHPEKYVVSFLCMGETQFGTKSWEAEGGWPS